MTYKDYVEDFSIKHGQVFFKDFPAVAETSIILVVPYKEANKLQGNTQTYLALFYARMTPEGKLIDEIQFIDVLEAVQFNGTNDDLQKAINAKTKELKEKIQNYYENRKDNVASKEENPKLFNEKWEFIPLTQIYLQRDYFQKFFDKLESGLNLKPLKDFLKYCRENLSFEEPKLDETDKQEIANAE